MQKNKVYEISIAFFFTFMKAKNDISISKLKMMLHITSDQIKSAAPN